MIANVNGLNEEVVRLLIDKNLTISSAESCTGGLFSALLTNVSGASEILNEAYVTYANSTKERILSVNSETLEKYGAVSEETAREMADGLYRKTGADIAVSITGIAGPGGGSEEKPVGLVYAGICVKGKTEVLKMLHSGNREKVREKTCAEVFLNIKNRICDQ